MPKRLERSRTEKMIAGVCGGLALYFDVDPVIVRVLFALAVVAGGIGILLYILLAIVMPQPAVAAIAADGTVVSAPPPAEPIDPVAAERRRSVAGVVLLAVGVLFLLNNSGILRPLEGRYLWPLALIAAGAYLLWRQRARV